MRPNDSKGESLITHIVLFRLIDRDQENIEETMDVLMSMKGKIPQLRSLVVGADILRSTRSYDLALIAKFDSMGDLHGYQTHPFHQGVLEFIARVKESSFTVDFEEKG
jgi:hypothetical protein